MSSIKPDFMIIGTQKGGTTSLYNYLIQHPQVAPASQKELHFFDFHYSKGISWYEAQFESKTFSHLVTGEASPYYMFHPLVPQRLKQFYPNIKIIVLLRNPVDRAISHYYHEIRFQFEKLSLEEALSVEPTRLAGEVEKLFENPDYYSFNHQHYTYLSRGLYADQLQEWIRIFPKEQFLILESESFYQNPETITNQVFEFLSLSQYQLPEYSKYNTGSYPPVNKKILHDLSNYFEPHNQRLEDFLNRKFSWSSTQNVSQVSFAPPARFRIDYESDWNKYAQSWASTPSQKYIGDEWIGKNAGAADSLAEYNALIEKNLIAPYINQQDTVLEIGIGGGKTASLLLEYCNHLVCADISDEMINVTRCRLGEERVSYVKLDGITLSNIPPNSIDVCFSYDTMVHLEPRDIYNYLVQIPSLLKGKRLCIFHHSNILTPRGWEKFLSEYKNCLLGNRTGIPFSIMTDTIMEKFLTYLGYEILLKQTEWVPRDCIWICKAPSHCESVQIN